MTSHGNRARFVWIVRYQPGTDLARRYPDQRRPRFLTREEAEHIRACCPNAESLEVVDDREVEA